MRNYIHISLILLVCLSSCGSTERDIQDFWIIESFTYRNENVLNRLSSNCISIRDDGCTFPSIIPDIEFVRQYSIYRENGRCMIKLNSELDYYKKPMYVKLEYKALDTKVRMWNDDVEIKMSKFLKR